MKQAFAFLFTLLLATGAWHLLRAKYMKPYPLLNPDIFFAPLENLSARDVSQMSDPKYFTQFGYLRGEKGTGIAITTWTKRPAPESDPYDVDMQIRVISTPSPEVATEGFILEEQQNHILNSKLNAVAVNIPLTADQFVAKCLQHPRLLPMYIVSARYGNYLFHFTARTDVGGYFENEDQLIERLKVLDAHIRETLQNAAQSSAM